MIELNNCKDVLMLKCPFYSEEMISSYIEGLLDEDESKIFEKHLMECDICLQSVINLRNDLFKMELFNKQLYKSKFMVEAVFIIIRNRFLILRDISSKYHFEKLQESFRLRGKNNETFYHVKIEDTDITVGKDSGEKFLMNFINVKGKSLQLFKDDRLIEAYNNLNDDKLVVKSLEKGEYIVVISDKSGVDNNRGNDKTIKIRVT